MKKILIFLGIIVTALALVSCANHGTAQQSTAQPEAATDVNDNGTHHHKHKHHIDYKGESLNK